MQDRESRPLYLGVINWRRMTGQGGELGLEWRATAFRETTSLVPGKTTRSQIELTKEITKDAAPVST